MANWYGAARTNYFPVKDAAAFKAWAVAACLRPHPSDTTDLWCLISETEDGGWPSELWDEGADDGRDFDVVAELAPHVPEGWPVVFMESGAEKRCYITGYAAAFRTKDGDLERIKVSLDDIYVLAEQAWGVAPTQCSY